jgi:hypothetical protein
MHEAALWRTILLDNVYWLIWEGVGSPARGDDWWSNPSQLPCKYGSSRIDQGFMYKLRFPVPIAPRICSDASQHTPLTALPVAASCVYLAAAVRCGSSGLL